MNQKEQAEFEELKELINQFEDAISKQETINLSEEEFEDIIHYYLRNNQAQNALEASEMALKRFPFSSEFCLTKADAHIELGELEAAETILVNNFKIDKSDIDFYIILSEVYLLKQDYEKAIEICNQGLEICEVDIDTLLLHLAEIYDYQGEYSLMVPLLEESIKLNSQNEDAIYLFSITMTILDRVQEKIEFLQEIIEEDPFNVNAWYYLGMSFKELGLYEKAIDSFEYIAAIDEENNDIVSDMAQAYLEAKSYQKAIDTLKEIERSDELNHIDHYTLGLAYKNLKDTHKAKFHFKECLTFDELQDEAYYQLAILFFDEAKYLAALPLITKALEKNEDIVHYLELKADILCELDQLDTALDIFERIIQLSNYTPYYLSKLAYMTSLRYGLEEALNILDGGIEDYKHYALYFHKAILNFAFSKEEEGYHQFSLGIAKDFDAHEIVFEKIPEMRLDPKIQLMIAHYSE